MSKGQETLAAKEGKWEAGIETSYHKMLEGRMVSERLILENKNVRLLLTLPVTFKVTCWSLDWIFASAFAHVYD